jgi:hypothetical protein
LNEGIKRLCPAENIIDNDLCVERVVDQETAFDGKCLPSGIKVMDKDDEDDWPINWSEWHNFPSIFGAIWAGKG